MALALRLFVHYAIYGLYADDAYIFMRYAENAAHGKGLMFNAGEPILGFTSTTFVLTLGALAASLPFVPLEESVSVLNSALFVACSLSLLSLSRREQRLPYLVPIVWFFYAPFVDGAVNGMETMLFLACAVGVIAAFCAGKFEWGAFGAFLAALTRPEGVLFFVCAAIALGRRPPKRWPFQGIGAGAALALAWGVYATVTYGSPIPQSMVSKSMLLQGGSVLRGATSALDKLCLMAVGVSSEQYLALSPGARSAVIAGVLGGLGLFAKGTCALFRRRSYSLSIPLFFLFDWVFYVVGGPVRIWSWYVVPSALAFVYAASLGLGELLTERALTRFAPAVMGVAALVMVATLPHGIAKRCESQRGMTLSLVRLARFIRERYPAARSIMIGDIGVVGYRCGGRIIDTGALVSPLSTFRDERGQALAYTQVIAREKPDIVSIPEGPGGWAALETFKSDEDRRFFEREYALQRAPGVGYLVFARERPDGR